MTRPLLFSLLFFSVGLFLSCGQQPAVAVRNCIRGIEALNGVQLNEHAPLKGIRAQLESHASRVIVLTSSNMQHSMAEAHKYGHALILVGQHTLVRITEPDKQERSASWGCELPWGTGYTQKNGEMEERSNYVNYLIGKPDNQSRVLFLFD